MKDTPFNTGLVDLNGIPLNEGDSIRFAYIDPMGKPHKEDLIEPIFKIEFTHGLFIARKEQNPAIWIPLYQHIETREGDYIPNYGNAVEFVNNILLAVKVMTKMRTRSSKYLFCCSVSKLPEGTSEYARYLVNDDSRFPKSWNVCSRDSNGAAKKFLTALKIATGDYANEVIRPGLVVRIWSDFKSCPSYELNSDLKLVRIE